MKSKYISLSIQVKDLSDNIVNVHQEMTQEEHGCVYGLLSCEHVWDNIVACHTNTIEDIQTTCVDYKFVVTMCIRVDVPESIDLNEIIDSGIREFGNKLCEEPMRLSESGILVKPYITSYSVS